MKVFLIAGEPSGDRLGGALMAGLRELEPDVGFAGVGGPQMQALGLRSNFPMEELSVMGLTEILPKYFALKRRIAETARAILADPPDVVVTIDSPDFCLRVARLVKAENPAIRTVHYVAPSVWAWRPKRVNRMVGVIDHVLALLPFEPPYMERAGIPCTFVGHPVVAEPVATQAQAEAFRRSIGAEAAPIVLCLPGSRRGEVSRLADVFGQAMGALIQSHPDAKIVLPCATPVAGLVRDLTADWPIAPILIDPTTHPDAAQTKAAAFAAADIALAASGTVSLELAANATPMVVAYRMKWLTHQIIKSMALIDTVTLVNLVSDTRVVPEYLGPDCQAAGIAAALSRVLADPTAQNDAMRKTMDRLGQGGDRPGLRAARAVLAAVNP